MFIMHLCFRATKSGGDSLQQLVQLSSSTRNYVTTKLEVGTEYQFQLMATVNNMIQEASNVCNITTEPEGNHLHAYVCTYV